MEYGIVNIDGIEQDVKEYKSKSNCGYKYTTTIGNYKFESIIFNECFKGKHKKEYDGDYKIKSVLYKNHNGKFKKIQLTDFFKNQDQEQVSKLIRLSIFNSLKYYLKKYAESDYLLKFPVNAYDWDFYLYEDVNNIMSLDKIGFSLEIRNDDILLVIKYILPSKRDKLGNRYYRMNYLDDGIKAYDEQYNAYISLYSIYKHINDNEEIIKILQNHLIAIKNKMEHDAETRDLNTNYEIAPDWNDAIVPFKDEKDEDCGCGGV
jgi:hypothetical protein